MTADTVGGVWTYSLDLARAMGEEGVEVKLATSGGLPSAAQLEEARAIPSLELYTSKYRLPWMDQPWDDVHAAMDWLQTLALRLEPDVVHLSEPVYASLDWGVPTVTVGHSCVLSWWAAVWGTPAPATWNPYREAMVAGLSRSSAVVAPSRWMLQQLRRFYGVRSGRVIPNGREPSSFESTNKDALIFAAGRVWDPAKNLLLLDEVAENLAWPIYVAGDPTHPDGRATRGAQHIHLLGGLSAANVAAWFRRSSIYAFPARYEPFGLSVLEAALTGCALVLGDIPTLREQWDGRAVFVPPEDPATLRLALESLIENPGLRHALAMRAQRHALTLTARRMALSYLDLYSDLMTQPTLRREVPACAS
jgi:glycogen(starch) synthase